MVVIEFDEYKGNKMIVIKKDENDTYPFKIGRTRAKLIIKAFEDIKRFAEQG